MKSKGRGRRPVSRCLICGSRCPKLESADDCHVEDEDQTGRIPGAGHCPLLKRQLLQIFILKELLQLPSSFCAQVLQQDNGNPDSWFQICCACTEDKVWRGWDIHQRLMALQKEMTVIRKDIQGKIRESVGDAGYGVGVEESIKKLFLPETKLERGAGTPLKPEQLCKVEIKEEPLALKNLFLEPEVLKRNSPSPPELEQVYDEDDDDDPPFLPESVEDDQCVEETDGEEEDDDDDEFVIPGPPHKTGRKRGRPFGSKTKNRHTHSKSRIRNKKEEEEDDDEYIPPAPAPPQKSGRKRGRPFGSKTINRHAHLKSRIRRKYKKRSRASSAEPKAPPPPHLTLRGLPRKNKKHPKLFKGDDPDMYVTRDGILKKKMFRWNKCEDCQTRFKILEEYEAHVSLHQVRKKTGLGELDCRLCGFPAVDSVQLDNHMVSRHENTYRALKKSYSCIKCKFGCTHWKHLKGHVDQEHPDMTREELAEAGLELKCPACGKLFNYLRSLNVHKRREHPELLGVKGEPTQCDQCNIILNSKLALKYHVLSAHKKLTRYVCETCGKGFRYVQKLELHKTSHDTKGDFVCHICGCDYPNKASLSLHHKKCHPEVVDPSTGSSWSGSKQGQSSSSEKTFKCNYCELTTPFSSVMKRHLETHKEQMGHRCEQCGRTYVNKQGLIRHLRLNHPLEKIEVPCPYCLKTYPSYEYMKDHVTKYCKLKDLNAEASNPANMDESVGMAIQQPASHNQAHIDSLTSSDAIQLSLP